MGIGQKMLTNLKLECPLLYVNFFLHSCIMYQLSSVVCPNCMFLHHFLSSLPARFSFDLWHVLFGQAKRPLKDGVV